jgi:lysophospholipase L1-like esterase
MKHLLMVSGTRRRAAAGAIGAFAILVSSVAAVLAGIAPASAAAVRIMPLGDSITEGYDGVAGTGPGGGYRIELEDDLAGAGISFDFVGSLQNGPPSLADRDHEGHRGYKNDDLRAGVPGWISAAAPDIVLLMSGTNDLKAGSTTTPQQAAASFAALLDQVLASAPNARVVVATIPNQWDATANKRVLDYNNLLPGVVSGRGPRVSLVDAYQIELYDGLHPSANGYERLGDIWFTELTRLLASSPPPPPPAGQWFGSLTPARLSDSRTPNSTVDGLHAGGGPIGAGNVIEIQVTGRGGVPANASAVALNVTAAGAFAAGFATVFPCGQPLPVASNLNFQAGQDIPNTVIAKIGTGGKVCIYTDKTTHLLADVNAWFI